ncbi:MAG: alpha/beta-hydrolase [Benniella sp.]|nr:MAG: alpha/beta-hydrolase [Benniella sp.]
MVRQSTLGTIARLAFCVLALTQLSPLGPTHASPVSPLCQKPEQPSDSFQSQQLQQDTHQIPFSSPRKALTVDQDLPYETVTLRHILHHGGNRFPRLFKKLDVSPDDVALSELTTGKSHTHRLKAKATRAIQPLDKIQGFRSPGSSLGPGSWSEEIIAVPDITDNQTVVELGMMNYNAYTVVGSPGWYDLKGHWNVNWTFGWEEEGIRGHVYTSSDNTTTVIAIKGTTAAFLGGGGGTSTRDKINDNRLFSCCCASVDRTWRTVCDCNKGGNECDQKCVEDSVDSEEVYYQMALEIIDHIKDEYPDAAVWLTGHSLGGGLVSLVGLTYAIPTVTFQAPGERLAAQRLHLPMPPAIDWNDIPLYHIGHTADPIFQGVCNGRMSTCYISGFAMESKCHTGRICVYDPVGEDNWGIDIRKHRLADTIEGVLKVKNVPPCKTQDDCEDCTQWKFTTDPEEKP